MGRMKAVRSEGRRRCHTSHSLVEKGCHRAAIGMKIREGAGQQGGNSAPRG